MMELVPSVTQAGKPTPDNQVQYDAQRTRLWRFSASFYSMRNECVRKCCSRRGTGQPAWPSTSRRSIALAHLGSAQRGFTEGSGFDHDLSKMHRREQ